MAKAQVLEARHDAVLVLEPVQQYIELEPSNRTDDGRMAGMRLLVEDLDRALLCQLPEPVIELLAPERAAQPAQHPKEQVSV